MVSVDRRLATTRRCRWQWRRWPAAIGNGPQTLPIGGKGRGGGRQPPAGATSTVGRGSLQGCTDNLRGCMCTPCAQSVRACDGCWEGDPGRGGQVAWARGERSSRSGREQKEERIGSGRGPRGTWGGSSAPRPTGSGHQGRAARGQRRYFKCADAGEDGPQNVFLFPRKRVPGNTEGELPPPPHLRPQRSALPQLVVHVPPVTLQTQPKAFQEYRQSHRLAPNANLTAAVPRTRGVNPIVVRLLHCYGKQPISLYINHSIKPIGAVLKREGRNCDVQKLNVTTRRRGRCWLRKRDNLTDSFLTNRASLCSEPHYGCPIVFASGRPGPRERGCARKPLLYKRRRLLDARSEAGAVLWAVRSCLQSRHNEGDRAPPGRAMREPDRGQGRWQGAGGRAGR